MRVKVNPHLVMVTKDWKVFSGVGEKTYLEGSKEIWEHREWRQPFQDILL